MHRAIRPITRRSSRSIVAPIATASEGARHKELRFSYTPRASGVLLDKM